MKRHPYYYRAAIAALTLCLLCPLTAAGLPIDVAQAREAVAQFCQQPTRAGKYRANTLADGLQHTFTQRTASGAPAVYVFNTRHGFVLASADDATVPILGYSDAGCFDPDNVPDGLRYLMGEYAKQIAALPPHRADVPLPTPDYTVETTDIIEPLLQTRWGQQLPYNKQCPYALSNNPYAATGCMTTAMAQIMRYHAYPTTGYGSREMEATQGIKKVHVERDYYTRHYRWDLMHHTTAEYTKSSSVYSLDDPDVAAVSELMMDVAVGLSTQFAAVSSAVNIAIIPMMLSYFNYDTSMEEVKLAGCESVEAFNHLLLTDLLAGRPVYLQGGPVTAGHAFVCDGYDGEGRFHINWGWEGLSDGHYLITSLTPSSAGVGGTAGAGYSENLLMIHNIMPCQSGIVPRPQFQIYYHNEGNPGYALVDNADGTYYFGAEWGVTPNERNIRGRLGLLVVDANGHGEIVWNQHQTYTQLLRFNAYYDFHVDARAEWLAAGTRVYYIYQECGEDQWHYALNNHGAYNSFTFTADADGHIIAHRDSSPPTYDEGEATDGVAYTLLFEGAPEGATVTIDGQPYADGATYTAEQALTTIDVSNDDYNTAATIDAATHVIRVVFSRYAYAVTLHGAPEGATILIGGQPYADGATYTSKTPVTTADIDATCKGYATAVTVSDTGITVAYIAESTMSPTFTLADTAEANGKYWTTFCYDRHFTLPAGYTPYKVTSVKASGLIVETITGSESEGGSDRYADVSDTPYTAAPDDTTLGTHTFTLTDGNTTVTATKSYAYYGEPRLMLTQGSHVTCATLDGAGITKVTLTGAEYKSTTDIAYITEEYVPTTPVPTYEFDYTSNGFYSLEICYEGTSRQPIIAAGEGILIAAAAPTTAAVSINPVPHAAAALLTDNLLWGCLADATKDMGNGYIYKLSLNAANDAGSIGFYWDYDGGHKAATHAGKAYLVLTPQTDSPHGFRLDGEKTVEPTADGVGLPIAAAAAAPVFNLCGQRMGTHLPAGVYVKGGKKFVIR